MHIGKYDQIYDSPQNLGGKEVQIWDSIGKMSKLQVF